MNAEFDGGYESILGRPASDRQIDGLFELAERFTDLVDERYYSEWQLSSDLGSIIFEDSCRTIGDQNIQEVFINIYAGEDDDDAEDNDEPLVIFGISEVSDSFFMYDTDPENEVDLDKLYRAQEIITDILLSDTNVDLERQILLRLNAYISSVLFGMENNHMEIIHKGRNITYASAIGSLVASRNIEITLEKKYKDELEGFDVDISETVDTSVGMAVTQSVEIIIENHSTDEYICISKYENGYVDMTYIEDAEYDYGFIEPRQYEVDRIHTMLREIWRRNFREYVESLGDDLPIWHEELRICVDLLDEIDRLHPSTPIIIKQDIIDELEYASQRFKEVFMRANHLDGSMPKMLHLDNAYRIVMDDEESIEYIESAYIIFLGITSRKIFINDRLQNVICISGQPSDSDETEYYPLFLDTTVFNPHVN